MTIEELEKEHKFKDVGEGEWQYPVPNGYLMKCCDCGLVHRIDFRVVKVKKGLANVQNDRYRVALRAWRVDD